MAAALDFSGKEQLYSQLYDILFRDITGGVYSVGDLIPSESELMRVYGVSRATARKAMEMLSNNGLIRKRRGRGSEVISVTPANSVQRVMGYVKKHVDDQVVPQKRVVDATVVPADEETARVLHLMPEAPVYRLRRVRHAGDKPFYIEINQFEAAYIPHAVEHDFSEESLRAFLFGSCGVQWSRASQEIYATVADQEMADFLQVAVGAPLLLIDRISYDTEGIPRESVKTYYRADLYHLEIELGS